MLARNQVLDHQPTGNRWRVLELDATTGTVWLFNMDDRTGIPVGFPADLVEGDADFVEVEPPNTVTRLKPTAAEIRRRDAALAAIEPLVATLDIFDASTRSARVLARAKELACSPQTIYAYLRAWWKNGQSRQALTPRFARPSNLGKGTLGRGRPTLDGTQTYQLGPDDHACMQQAIDEVFLKNELMTFEGTYQTLLEKHYSYIDGEGSLMLKIPGERPSMGQFRRYARNHVSAEQVLRARKGSAEFELKHRAVLGSLRHATFTVGDVYEIDSTVADVMLVHQDDRSKIVGKPSLYLVRDRKSSLIVGVYVGFEEASWLAAQQAIMSITEDKAALCRQYGVAYNPADWPAHRMMPKEFVADRGPEMLSNQSNRIADGLELTVTNLPARRGDWKPHVEFGFRQTQRAMRAVIPGYVPPEDLGKRQRRDFGKDAALTLDEFRGVVMEIVIRLNNSPMREYPLAPQYILQGVQPTPINIWNAEVRHRAGLLTQYTEAEVRLALLPQTEVTVTREGIRLGDCFYGAKEAADYGWFVHAGNGRFNVTASYDLRCVDIIYIHDERNPDLHFEARLLDKCSHLRGMSHREVEALSVLRKALNREGEALSRQRAADYHAVIAGAVRRAKQETKQASQGKSRSARKKDTRAAREDTLRLERQASVRPAVPPGAIPGTDNVIPLTNTAVVSGANPSTPLQKSRQQQYEELIHGR